MLRWEAVRPEQLGVLERISANPDFSPFFLVGGTGLALLIGRPISIDLDFFTRDKIDFRDLAQTDLKNFPDANVFNANDSDLNTIIQGVKVDFVHQYYPFINPLKQIEGITHLSKFDIASQKVYVILGPGSKKDFYDLYYLFKDFTLKEIVEGYQRKYGNFYASMIIRSIIWFDDAENQPDSEVFDQTTREEVKSSIRETIYNNAKDFNA